MAQRPSTLTTLRVFLDLCDELQGQPGQVSTRDLADRLQKKYQEMPAAERAKWLALASDAPLPEEKFPAQATVLRYIDYAEEDLKPYYPGRFLIPRIGRGERAALGQPTDDVTRTVRTIFEGLFAQLNDAAGKKTTLNMAASDAVAAFFLPRIDVPKAIGSDLVLKVHRFRPRDIADQLQARVIDFAIAWNGYNDQVKTDHLEARDLVGSQSEVRLLFSSKLKPLADKRLKYLEEHVADDPFGVGFTVHPDDIRDLPVIHPELEQLERVADLFRRSGNRSCLRVDHLASVVGAVRSQMGVGLSFGLPWMLDELSHKDRILSARLGGTALGEDGVMKLKLYMRKGEGRATKGSESPAHRLVDALEQMLANHGYPPPYVKTSWEISGPAKLPKEVSFGKPKDWFVHFVTSGKFKNSVLPVWWFGRIEFEPAKKNEEAKGTLYLGGKSEPFMDVWQVSGPNADGCVVLRFKRKEPGNKLGEHTVAYFPCRVTNGQTDDRVILCGSLNFVVWEPKSSPAHPYPFSSPIILSNRPLDPSEYVGIARTHLLEFLDGDDATPFQAVESA